MGLAAELEPDDDQVAFWNALTLLGIGRVDEARASAEEAEEAKAAEAAEVPPDPDKGSEEPNR